MIIADRLALVASLQFGLGGPLDAHVYALRGRTGIVLVDAGAGTHTDDLLANVRRWCADVPVVALVLTHAHVDHCGGAAALRAATGCTVVAPGSSRRILEAGDEQASGLAAARAHGLYPPETRLPPCPVDIAAGDGQPVVVDGVTLTPISVRGHSPDSCCYLTTVNGSRWLFAGDAIFYGGILGVVNADGSGMGGYRSDLAKLRGLAIDGLFPGHGLFTLRNGQRHIDHALEHLAKGFLGPQIGQGGVPL